MGTNLFKVKFETVDGCFTPEFLRELDVFKNFDGVISLELESKGTNAIFFLLRNYEKDLKMLKDVLSKEEGASGDFMVFSG